MTAIRITYGKHGALRFLGHLDMSRLWLRTLRRAGLPLAFTAGYQPRPKIAMGPPLSLGFTSRVELLDVSLADACAPAQVHATLAPVLAPGLTVERIAAVTPDTSPLSNLATFSYLATFPLTHRPLDRAAVQERVDALLARRHVPIVRARKGRTKTMDLRPSIVDLAVAAPSNGHPAPPALAMTLAILPDGTANPREVLACLDLWDPAAIRDARIERSGVTFARDSRPKELHDTATEQDPTHRRTATA